MAVTPGGNIVPCQSWLSDQPLGNMLRDDWDAIWESEACMPQRNYSSEMTGECPLRRYCSVKDFKIEAIQISSVHFAALTGIPAIPVLADATDEIQDFTITVDVNEDASLNMTYHIDWEVLDDSIGDLEWIDLGVPNSYHENITPLSETIDHIDDKGSSLAIYLDRAYEEG